LHCTLQPQLNSSSLYPEKGNADGSPLVENGSLPIENSDMRVGDSKKSLSMLPAATGRVSKIDADGFKQYLLAQGKRN
jgi:hypothetical protein